MHVEITVFIGPAKHSAAGIEVLPPKVQTVLCIVHQIVTALLDDIQYNLLSYYLL